MYAIIMSIILLVSYWISRQKVEYRKFLIGIDTVISIIYIVWRLTVIPTQNGIVSLILGLTLFFAEVLGLIAFFNFKYLFTKKYKVELRTLDAFKGESIPSVDVLICTYNEPLHLLEQTIAACTNLDYPKGKMKIHVCDDGGRIALKLLCREYDVHYITREDNEGAKAGNINNALKQVQGELFAVLDADMIPKKNFLSRTVGYFSDENLAFVQVPQVYYNQDVYQYNLVSDIPNEQDFFMRDIQEARAARNSVLHVGTNAIFRRDYVEEIGGYPTYSITEDMAVGMLLQSKGYESLLINEELVLGLSATTFTELVKQRDRWCRGNIQVLKHFNPIFEKGLTLAQRISYFDGGVYWFSNLQKMIYIFSPIIYLLTARLIIDSTIQELLNVYMPFMLGQILIFKMLSPGNRKLTWAHFYEVAMAPHLTVSLLKEVLCIKAKFNVTSKEIQQDRKEFQFKVAFPHLMIILITLVAWGVSTYFVIRGQMYVDAYLLNMVWSVYNVIGSAISIKVAYQKPIFRSSERIIIQETIIATGQHGKKRFNLQLVDLSGRGMGVNLQESVHVQLGDIIHVTLKGTLMKCKVIRVSDEVLGLSFMELTPQQMQLVMGILTQNMQAYYTLNKSQEYINQINEVGEVSKQAS